MKVSNILMATVATGVLSIGVLTGTAEEANAKTYSQNGIILHDDSLLLDHELSYVDTLLDENTSDFTKQKLQKYFADQGLYSVSDIVKKAEKDGLDISKYKHLIK
ncbi:SPIN family peroxidase inhibitor [Mammaliicoccus stepanovicii]|uniref:Exported protein n=1 Tax=Mammaliicoccus stepanovicii TaxID=643214 RepID=A0A239ZF85_9STAP|nr:SPIN family peroxidase inhibitor [Mammaliicoccus stepanovicii]PNZ71778.1 hypothetical protein CD111_12140 [Mammaliicoccus stepanovicii]GGI41940.1 hypothetical protein GCM10010896_15930 [Mammaliicoccus stepanovicii]SNV69673.1 exported protein [Mammaliicoccus stepanovicii]